MTAFDLTWGKAWKAGAQLECHEEWKVDKRLKSEEAVIAFNLLPLLPSNLVKRKEFIDWKLKLHLHGQSEKWMNHKNTAM